MPYASNDDLPPAVRDHLPEHAQDIFREAFNHAWQQHAGDEQTAFRIAWGAVKRHYRKQDDRWVPLGR
ncbi:MAG TPA: ChaB family protein [Acetobacteraceae bacterium]|nr:ChaB family protein [Acetobacteraceae bacterium]